MRSQADVEVEIAIAAAVETLATLAGQPQPLTIGGTLGDTRAQRVRYAAQAALGVVLGHVQIQIDLRALNASSIVMVTAIS